MKNKQMEAIKKEIDDLIKEVTSGGETPSDDFLDELEGISNDLISIKEKEKAKQAQELNNKLDALIEVATESGELSSVTTKQIVDAIQKIKIDTPAPLVTVAPPKVEVTMPPIRIPHIVVPEVKIPPTQVSFPKEMEIKKPSWVADLIQLKPITERLDVIRKGIIDFVLPRFADDPISVRLSDGEKFYRALGGLSSSIGSFLSFKKSDNTQQAALVDDDSHVQVDVLTMPDVTVNTGDIEIGAVEIKNSTDDTRATVGANGLYVETRLTPQYATQLDEASSTVTYIGEAAIGSATSEALWRIKKLTVSGSVTGITWAGGSQAFTNIWDNRAALSYS